MGQNITLTATCNNAPTSYVWTGCTSTGPTCVATAAAAGTVTYTVAGVNAIGKGAAAACSRQLAGRRAPGARDFCGSYNNVIRTSVAWGDLLAHHDRRPWAASRQTACSS